MQVRQFQLDSFDAAGRVPRELQAFAPHLLLGFGHHDLIENGQMPGLLAAAAPTAVSAGCSSAGVISTLGIAREHSIVTAVRFDHPNLHIAKTLLRGMDDSEQAGLRLGNSLKDQRPHTVLILGQGIDLNGSALVRGMREALGPDATLIGGLANDGDKFRRTLVYLGTEVGDKLLLAIAFSDPRLTITHGSVGGWRPFGPVRRITRCAGNVLFELDGESALEVYKRYLGDEVAHLPGSALLFPFSMLDEKGQDTGVIRTILGLDEINGCLTLAGEIIENGYLRLMLASPDDLITGAEMAAEEARSITQPQDTESFALLVSCIGRLLSLGQRTDEEVDAVASILGPSCVLSGFYSNGEISARASRPEYQLHNQTMTVTRFCEAA